MNNREVLRWMTGITRPVHQPLLWSTLCRIINQLCDIALFVLLFSGVGGFLWQLLHPSQGPVDRVKLSETGAVVFGGLVLLAVAKAVFYYLEQFSGHYVAFKALELLRTGVFRELWPKAPAVLWHSRSGDLLASITRDIDRIEVVYAHTFAPVVSAVITPIIALTVAFSCAPWPVVVGPTVTFFLLVFVLPWCSSRKAMRATAQTLRERRDLTHHVTDSIFGGTEIRGYQLLSARQSEQAQLADQIIASSGISQQANAHRRAGSLILENLTLFWVIGMGIATHTEPILLLALLGGTLRLFEAPRGVEDAISYLDHSFAAARRLWEISQQPQLVTDGPDRAEYSHAPAVTWDNVSYAYPDINGQAGQPVLKNIQLTAPAGKKTMILGVSGSGKSSLVQLLLRYDNPSSGQIRLDKTGVEQYQLDSLRKTVVLVAQKNQHLGGSIADNLRLAKPDVTETEMWQVLEHADLAQQVKAMPKQLETTVGERGGQLSGGQNQRLALARALLCQPKVLVLDEFTAALDTQTAQRIREKLHANYPDLTIIEVTHRAEGIKTADQIVLLERGEIVAKGTPAELLNGQSKITQFIAENE